MGVEEKKGRLFSSWKEIADYLGCDVRTCRRWELTRGLPIHRLDGGSRSRIFAYQHELDDWVKGKNGTSERLDDESRAGDLGPAEPAPAGARLMRRYLYFGIPFIAAGALLFLYFLRPFARHSDPHDFRIDGSELVVLAKNGRELWRFDTHIENLIDDKAYHSRFQRKKESTLSLGVNLPWVIIKDINRDQKSEVLFCTWASDEHRGGDLICFGKGGKEIWRFKGGREMWCGTRPYSSEYNTAGFDTLDIDGDGSLETVVISHQTPNWLAQLALIDSNGRMIGEFWNSGHLADFILADLQSDGRKELLVVGLNNEYERGCLIVFDPRAISGGSPQSKAEFTCRGVKPGTEEYYLLFPRTDVDIESHPVEAVGKIVAENPNILSLETAISGIYFILDFDLAVEDVTLSHGFMQKHHEALLAGKVHSSLDDPGYKEALIKGVLYYDGKGWTTKPMRVERPPQ
ncbi:MAG: hypothetical protein A2W03_13350 [Candidatus Aminicenantes bacterium RBG_16_63_16]|nr:MAG: hypothetical protein A2W03_13350 [Candidatus Aminicenantes bacterium RBG_16_63_16]